MWRLYRKTIFPRWHVHKQKPVENKNASAASPKIPVLSPSTHQKNHSDDRFKRKQHANNQDGKFWDDLQFRCNVFGSSLLETAGFLGTAAAVFLNIHQKRLKSIFDYKTLEPNCIFSRYVLATPHSVGSIKSISLSDHKSNTSPIASNSEEPKDEKVYHNLDVLEDLRKLPLQYAAALENSAGFSCVNESGRKAFRHFQAAARLGSSQGFYNLGLCYELGKGTRVNLNRAAFCYKKAAMKGHGLAAFNLAVYFLKGIGGLPVDIEAAKLLLTAAAEKGVPEAQLYLGLECLEDENFSDAYLIFQNMANNNILDGKYYLGLCYENGWGVQRNEKVAAEIFSQCAILGHSKAILRLGNYFEKGQGGCELDYQFSLALYQILADKGDEEGLTAVTKLKPKIQNSATAVCTKTSNRVDRNNMHISTSFPELTSKKSSDSSFSTDPLPPYLNIIPPFIHRKVTTVHEVNKKLFYIGDDKPNVNFSVSLRSSIQSNIHLAVSAET
ncbi:Death ligand signal enhancer, partial [Stegodyphus mimosarum]